MSPRLGAQQGLPFAATPDLRQQRQQAVREGRHAVGQPLNDDAEQVERLPKKASKARVRNVNNDFRCTALSAWPSMHGHAAAMPASCSPTSVFGTVPRCSLDATASTIRASAIRAIHGC